MSDLMISQVKSKIAVEGRSIITHHWKLHASAIKTIKNRHGRIWIGNTRDLSGKVLETELAEMKFIVISVMIYLG